jgi:hypothetical protein
MQKDSHLHQVFLHSGPKAIKNADKIGQNNMDFPIIQSPMLFVMAAEFLQCIINKAHHMGLIQMPIPQRALQIS